MTDHTRLTLLHTLAQGDAGREALTKALSGALGADAATVSQQLSRLRLARLISSYKDGDRVVYSLPDPHLRRMVTEALLYAGRLVAEPAG